MGFYCSCLTYNDYSRRELSSKAYGKYFKFATEYMFKKKTNNQLGRIIEREGVKHAVLDCSSNVLCDAVSEYSTIRTCSGEVDSKRV